MRFVLNAVNTFQWPSDAPSAAEPNESTWSARSTGASSPLLSGLLLFPPSNFPRAYFNRLSLEGHGFFVYLLGWLQSRPGLELPTRTVMPLWSERKEEYSLSFSKLFIRTRLSELLLLPRCYLRFRGEEWRVSLSRYLWRVACHINVPGATLLFRSCKNWQVIGFDRSFNALPRSRAIMGLPRIQLVHNEIEICTGD